MTVIPFAHAKAYVLPFGQHAGRTLDDIASTDEGLAYLDWLRGNMDAKNPAQPYLAAYLDDPTIAKDLTELLARKGRHR